MHSDNLKILTFLVFLLLILLIFDSSKRAKKLHQLTFKSLFSCGAFGKREREMVKLENTVLFQGFVLCTHTHASGCWKEMLPLFCFSRSLFTTRAYVIGAHRNFSLSLFLSFPIPTNLTANTERLNLQFSLCSWLEKISQIKKKERPSER